jgi:hypothetical protein
MFDLSQISNRPAIYCFRFCRGAWTGHRMALSFCKIAWSGAVASSGRRLVFVDDLTKVSRRGELRYG